MNNNRRKVNKYDNEYKNNKKKPNGYWNRYDICKEEALKYKNRSSFKKNSSSCFSSSIRNKWLDDICSHMIGRIKKIKNKSVYKYPNGYWYYERCKEFALKFYTRNEFKKGCRSGYDKALKNKWLDDICSHMIAKYIPKGYYNNYNICKEEALKYNTRNEFKNTCRSGYEYSLKNKWLDEFFPKIKK